ncbi:FecR family protein [Sphingobacterium hotanense]|uniref:FecR family protein n=1 Tax=Sphingobacterium hotanense TaxID=649196 RepID=A0ABT7NJB6_9SPHI|nr:FecR family protein [Sphingobacterium hotanense]MDM1047283.1 FecR family protein [Sphingobacterium hotanense]
MSSSPVFAELLKKYVNNSLNKDEFQQFFLLVNELSTSELEAAFAGLDLRPFDLYVDAKLGHSNGRDLDSEITRIWGDIAKECANENDANVIPLLTEKRSINPWKWIAAAVVLFLGLGIIWKLQTDKQVAQHTLAVQQSIVPAENESIITLPNGKEIIIREDASGVLFKDDAYKVVKNDRNELLFETNSDAGLPKTEVAYNTVQTSTGGFTSFLLPDGSKVYLSSRSSLKFIVNFEGDSRQVTLSGEAYFEVKKRPNAPFQVITDKQVVEVLGTHFNIRVYPDESQQLTTLIEGKVKVTDAKASGNEQGLILNPGEQAYLSNNELIKRKVETDVITGWKSNRFIYKNTNIYTVLKDIERWYGVEFVFGMTSMQNQFIYGNVSRNVPLNELLDVLSKNTTLKFTSKERRVYVNP